MVYPFFSTCVNWPNDLHAAKDFLDENGEEISREAFLELVPASRMRKIEKDLGYGGPGGLKMADDWHVQYRREPQTGIPFFIHSATEFVFSTEKALRDLNERLLDGPFAEETVLLYRPGLMSGLEPPAGSQESDLFEHHLFAIMDASAPVVIVEGPESDVMNLNDRRILDQTIALLRSSGRLALHETHDGNVPDLQNVLGRFLGAIAVTSDLCDADAPSIHGY